MSGHDSTRRYAHTHILAPPSNPRPSAVRRSRMGRGHRRFFSDQSGIASAPQASRAPCHAGIPDCLQSRDTRRDQIQFPQPEFAVEKTVASNLCVIPEEPEITAVAGARVVEAKDAPHFAINPHFIDLERGEKFAQRARESQQCRRALAKRDDHGQQAGSAHVMQKTPAPYIQRVPIPRPERCFIDVRRR